MSKDKHIAPKMQISKLEFKQMRARLAKKGEAGEYSSYFPVPPFERNAAIAA